MKTYYLDEKNTIRTRKTFEAENDAQAKQMVADNDQDVLDGDSEYLYETITDMIPEDNSGHATIELSTEENDIIYQNGFTNV